MELLLISDSKLKVILTPEDMEYYDISCETLDYENSETRRAFWNILADAKQKTGFDAATDKVFVQIFPSKFGGCEMFITKMDKKASALTCVIPRESRKSERYTYKFEDMKSLIAVCRHMKKCGYTGASSAFYDPRIESYYLMYEDNDYIECIGYGLPKLTSYPVAGEYGEEIESSLGNIAYFSEHCNEIVQNNAVDILSNF